MGAGRIFLKISATLFLIKTYRMNLLSAGSTSLDSAFKGAQVWDFWPIFFDTNKSYMGRWLEDWREKKNFSKTTADIRDFVFFTQAEPALKICLRRLNLR